MLCPVRLGDWSVPEGEFKGEYGLSEPNSWNVLLASFVAKCRCCERAELSRGRAQGWHR